MLLRFERLWWGARFLASICMRVTMGRPVVLVVGVGVLQAYQHRAAVVVHRFRHSIAHARGDVVRELGPCELAAGQGALERHPQELGQCESQAFAY